MIERLRPARSAPRERRGAPRSRRRSAPPLPPPPAAYGVEESTILGFPADTATDDAADVATEQSVEAVEPETRSRLVVARRSDLVAGSLLVLAGVAANVSLWLPWVEGESRTGITLVRSGFRSLDSGFGELLRAGLWQPMTIVVGGGLLVVLGALLFVPAHTHRLVGVMALVVSLAATGAVLSLLAGADWTAERFDIGMWCGVAVAGLGLVGALKAMLTLPLVSTD